MQQLINNMEDIFKVFNSVISFFFHGVDLRKSQLHGWSLEIEPTVSIKSHLLWLTL